MNPFYCGIESSHFLFVKGPDAQKFLQGQTSCDFKQLNDHSYILGSSVMHKVKYSVIFVHLNILKAIYCSVTKVCWHQ